MTEQASMQNLGELFAALAAAQAEMGKLTTDGKAKVPTKNGQEYSYTYASLAQVLGVARPALAKHGLALVQYVDEGVLISVLGHSSGQSITARWAIPAQNGPQAVGSVVTYWRRYQAMALLGLAPEDDDGAAAQLDAKGQRDAQRAAKGGKPRAEAPPLQRLERMGWDPDSITKALNGKYEVEQAFSYWAEKAQALTWLADQAKAGAITMDDAWGDTPRQAAEAP